MLTQRGGCGRILRSTREDFIEYGRQMYVWCPDVKVRILVKTGPGGDDESSVATASSSFKAPPLLRALLRSFFGLCSAVTASSSFKISQPLPLRALRLRCCYFFELCSAASSSSKAPWPSLRALRLCDFFELKALQRLRAFRLCAIASSSSRLRSVFKLLGPVAFVSSSFKAPLPLFLWAKAPWLLLLCEFLVTLPGKSSSKVAVVLKLAYTMLRRSLKPATTSKPMLCSNDAAMIGWFLKLSTMLKPIFSFDRRVEANLARKVLP
ncbi:hypothetical protein RHGRI_020869 [Rhododendron griersonianum]|uniref:Uncharacterized protein n=1 Tax=Rhododendron griersonianum TaxID=479676 RepID=A0AAV6JLW2_9ERIC|nr:hypothetical protein RHGRI_020869 [Rhododendron griersonianum]